MTEQPLAADCDPNWRDDPAGLDALCERGARELHAGTAAQGRKVDTVPLTGNVL